MANLVMDGVTIASKSGSTVTVQGTNVTIDNGAFPSGHVIQISEGVTTAQDNQTNGNLSFLQHI